MVMKKSLKERLVPMNRTEKRQYIWHYYKYHMIGLLVVIILVAGTINNAINKKDTVLSIMIVGEMINTTKIEELAVLLNEELLTDEERVSAEILIQSITHSTESLDPSMQVGIQKFMAELATREIDVLVVDKGFFYEMSEDEQTLNLEKLAGMQPLPLAENDVYRLKDNKDYVSGIKLAALSFFTDAIFDEDTVLFVPANTKREDNIPRFLEYLFNN